MTPPPRVASAADLPAIEAVPLAERGLPSSTYELLAGAAARHPDAPALHMLRGRGAPWHEADSWTYAELLAQVHRAANLYRALGLPDGGTVGILLPNTGHTYAAFLGAQAVGVAGPVNPALAEDDIAEILTLTDARILVAAGPELAPGTWRKAVSVAGRLPRLRTLLAVGAGGAVPPGDFPPGVAVGDFAALAAAQPDGPPAGVRPRRSDDLAAFFHTGGTTGTPKVAPHTHAAEVYAAWALGLTGLYAEPSVMLGGLPLFHVNGVHATGLGPFLHGACVVSLGPLGYRDKGLMADFWRIVAGYHVSGMSAVPTVYAALPDIPPGLDISSLRRGAVGGGPLPAAVEAAFGRRTGIRLMQGYGLTEATCITTFMPPGDVRAGSVGLRLPYQQVRAVHLDEEERPTAVCPPGERGILAVKGPAVFPGYLRKGPDGPAPDPAGTVFDGWLVTGDVGHVDADGYAYLTGRAKDLIIRGGHNIDPAPVEDGLLEPPDVTAAAVVARPDAYAGEVPVAYVTLRAGTPADTERLLAWAAERAPERAAAPKAVHVLESLPATVIGKVSKQALRQDAVRRVVAAELERAAVSGDIEVTERDGRTLVRIVLGPAEPHVADSAVRQLTDALSRYAFAHELAAGHNASRPPPEPSPSEPAPPEPAPSEPS
ncbi:acyl-CoA synthetase [Streptomyces sp. NPDC052023]|uniref:acyl-CoA synthetase n=1 Tax=Streptomyces sp. NPDC052023 TaxID=3365681 RepID=UPI0037D25839